MKKNKTVPTKVSVAEYLKKKAGADQLGDCQTLVKLFKRVSGEPARMWGPSIVGFGSYHYVYDSGREGDAPLVGFAVRGKELVLYLAPTPSKEKLLAKLGKHKAGAGCVYIKKLEDVDPEVLEQLAVQSIEELRRRYPKG